MARVIDIRISVLSGSWMIQQGSLLQQPAG